MKQNVSSIPIKDLCCSCGACIEVCNHMAIKSVFRNGLFVPEIDHSLCTGCQLCLKVCPSAHIDVQTVYGVPDLFSEEEKECYIAYSSNKSFRNQGTSGGVVSTIVFELLNKGAYEKAYVLDFERFDGQQAIIRPISKPNDVTKSAKSKYIPASIAEVIKDIKNDSIGQSIIVATPCQLLAIKNFLGLKKYNENNILFIGLFCDKTLNYNIYGYYSYKYGNYDSLHFRDKAGNGWPGDTVLVKSDCMTVVDKDVRISLKPYFQLNRCRFCFDKLNQLADISCGDCYIKGEESEYGKSSIVVRTARGGDALRECSSSLHLEKSSFTAIKQSQQLRLKLDNYQRNSASRGPFIISDNAVDKSSVALEGSDESKLIMGAKATRPKDFKNIDKIIAKDNNKPRHSKIIRIAKRIIKLIYNPDKKINVLIDNAGFINKGAELMLQSVVQQLDSKVPNVRIVVPESVFYSNLNYCHKHHILPMHLVYGGKKKFFKHFVYHNLLNKPWFITPDQIDIVLDAGGFQFSDQWEISETYLTERKRYYSSFTKKGRKIIFLPQAFGPFEKPLSKLLMRYVYEVADLIYAREPESYRFLHSLFPKDSKIRIAPDFTCLSIPSDPSAVVIPGNYIVVIANVRMVSHTQQDVSDNYMWFLQQISEFLLSKNKTLVLLNHEGIDDLNLLLELNTRLSQKALLLSGLDALETKRIIGGAEILISSRFHGVVSGLTQGVPTLCTSWSHKYLELLKEHGCDESNLLSINNLDYAKKSIEAALKNPSAYTSRRECLSGIRKRAMEMWNDIWETTGLSK